MIKNADGMEVSDFTVHENTQIPRFRQRALAALLNVPMTHIHVKDRANKIFCYQDCEFQVLTDEEVEYNIIMPFTQDDPEIELGMYIFRLN